MSRSQGERPTSWPTSRCAVCSPHLDESSSSSLASTMGGSTLEALRWLVVGRVGWLRCDSVHRPMLFVCGRRPAAPAGVTTKCRRRFLRGFQPTDEQSPRSVPPRLPSAHKAVTHAVVLHGRVPSATPAGGPVFAPWAEGLVVAVARFERAISKEYESCGNTWLPYTATILYRTPRRGGRSGTSRPWRPRQFATCPWRRWWPSRASGEGGFRTLGLRLAKPLLYQLSYIPM